MVVLEGPSLIALPAGGRLDAHYQQRIGKNHDILRVVAFCSNSESQEQLVHHVGAGKSALPRSGRFALGSTVLRLYGSGNCIQIRVSSCHSAGSERMPNTTPTQR